MKAFWVLLSLLAVSASGEQLLDSLLDSYTYSNYKLVAENRIILLLWTVNQDTFDFAVVGRMNFVGNEGCQSTGCWLATGWNPEGSSSGVMINSTVVLAQYHPNGTTIIEERYIWARDAAQLEVISKQFTGATVLHDGNYLILQFSRPRTSTPALNAGATWSCMSMRPDLFELSRHGPNYGSAQIDFETGVGATPVARCNSTNCINGECTDALLCTCNSGWAGSKCDTATSSPNSPASPGSPSASPSTGPGASPPGTSSAANPVLDLVVTVASIVLGAGMYFM